MCISPATRDGEAQAGVSGARGVPNAYTVRSGSRLRLALRDASASETIASMPRLLVRAAVALLAFCLFAPAAHADGLGTLQDLAKRHLRPAPLVPTAAPSPLSDLGVRLT